MIPIPCLENVKCAWIEIQAQGFCLHGFLVFLASDHNFPEYIEGDGLGDLDVWSGSDCAIFMVHSPSAAWIDYTRATGHAWWKLFGNIIDISSETAGFLAALGNERVLEIGGARRTLKEVFAPSMNQFQHGHEISKILHRFNLSPTDHPSLILFKDLYDTSVWHVDLKSLVGIPERDLRASLQRWFSSADFKLLIEESRHA